MKKHANIIRQLVFIFLSTLFLCYILYDYVSHDPVFGPARVQKMDTMTDIERYVRDREKRNITSMNYSYDELLSIARAYEKAGERSLAIEHYFTAKTIFPDRVEPRVRMCYLYLKGCQEDWRYCRPAKKELYYAQKYMENADIETQAYISRLVSLMGMNDLVEMDEKEAMSFIF